MPPTMMPPPIGYICMLRDPAGNMVEFSWDQGVFATAVERWSASEEGIEPPNQLRAKSRSSLTPI